MEKLLVILKSMEMVKFLLFLGVLLLVSCKTVYYKSAGKTTVVTTDTTYTEHGASYYYPDGQVIPSE